MSANAENTRDGIRMAMDANAEAARQQAGKHPGNAHDSAQAVLKLAQALATLASQGI